MTALNPKVSSNPGLLVAKRLLSLVLIGCILVFFGLVWAGEEITPDDPDGEHPWDELKSGTDHQPPSPSEVIMLPCGDFGAWMIIHLSQAKDRSIGEERVQTHSSDENRCQYFILF